MSGTVVVVVAADATAVVGGVAGVAGATAVDAVDTVDTVVAVVGGVRVSCVDFFEGRPGFRLGSVSKSAPLSICRLRVRTSAWQETQSGLPRRVNGTPNTEIWV